MALTYSGSYILGVVHLRGPTLGSLRGQSRIYRKSSGSVPHLHILLLTSRLGSSDLSTWPENSEWNMPGAIYHMLSRGDRREAIFHDRPVPGYVANCLRAEAKE